MHWDFKPNRKRNMIRLALRIVDLTDRDQWPRIHEWLQVKLEGLDRVFRPLVSRLDSRLPDEDA